MAPTMTEGPRTFFNLPSAGSLAHIDRQALFGPSTTRKVATNWSTFEDQSISSESVIDLFANRIPVVRVKNFLTDEERKRMLDVVRTHEFGAYDLENTWPRVGIAGITQYDHISDKPLYFNRVDEARSLQKRWKQEASVDVMGRVVAQLQALTDMKVRIATEDDREYFAGITRAVDKGIGVHADFAPYEAAGWSISQSVAQITLNILLNKVPGGDTLIYDKAWVAPDDDIEWRKEFPRDSYHPQMLQGHPFKAMEAIPGDLTFFNPRNFHEVKACDVSKDHPIPDIRFTVSSFVGFVPGDASKSGELVLWS